MTAAQNREFTHVCVDCGALGVAGGYHDHGNGNAGETIPLASLPTVIHSFQRIENERDELREELSERDRAAGFTGGGWRS